MRAEGQADRVALHRFGDRHRARDLTHLQDRRAVDDARDRRRHVLRGAIEDLVHLVLVRVEDLELEEEAIQLRLRQRIGPLHLERVLGREHEERLLQPVGRLADRDAHVLHRFEQRRLRFRGRAVDLVGEHDVGEDRPRLKLEEGAAVRRLLHDVGADDVGRHQVGGELNARERQVQHVGEGVHQARLADAGNALEQHVSAGEQTGHGQADGVLLPDDAAADLAGDLLETLAELIDGFGDGGSGHCLRMK
jgi:hypothetical protein